MIKQTSASRAGFLAVLVLLLSAGQGRGAENESSQAVDQKWGDLQIRFALEGDPPPPKKLDTSKEPGCGKLDLVDETLVVGPQGGIKNVFVWLESEPTAVHPDIVAAAKNDVTLHIQNCRFEPRATVLAIGQVLHVKNRDSFGHAVHYSPFENAPGHPLVPSGTGFSLSMNAAENSPIPVVCSIHPWMIAHFLIRPNLYAAVSNRDGLVKIAKLPIGKHMFCAWNNRCLEGVKTEGKDAGWKKGRFEVEIKDGEKTRLDVTVAPAVILGRSMRADK